MVLEAAHPESFAGAVEHRKFRGPVEIDEAYIGGFEKNKHADRKLHMGRGGVGKTIIAGSLDRETNTLAVEVVAGVNRKTLHDFVRRHVLPGCPVYTDELASYDGLENRHFVNHQRGEYVRGAVHTNAIEGAWAVFKPATRESGTRSARSTCTATSTRCAPATT